MQKKSYTEEKKINEQGQNHALNKKKKKMFSLFLFKGIKVFKKF